MTNNCTHNKDKKTKENSKQARENPRKNNLTKQINIKKEKAKKTGENHNGIHDKRGSIWKNRGPKGKRNDERKIQRENVRRKMQEKGISEKRKKNISTNKRSNKTIKYKRNMKTRKILQKTRNKI